MFKKSNKLLIVLIVFICFKNSIYGISENFKFVIETIGIPRYNVNFEEINEDIYYTYNVFVYSSPEKILNNNLQRFKEVLGLGKWTRYNGKYIGIGERGEYYLLGKDYSGSVISNVFFPVDVAPESSPDKWNYIVTNGAYKSWQNSNKYKYTSQLEYMKNTNILFDEIDFIQNKTNPYNLVEYNINANNIGLDKAMLEACSTWKTRGVITIRRLTPSNKIRSAIFSTKPIAANADIKSKIKAPDKTILDEKEENKSININVGTDVVNLNNYASKEQVKELVSTIYINDKEICKISGSKTINLDKNISFIVSRKDYLVSKTYPIKITVKSYLYTEFSIDGLIQDEVTKTIYLEVKEKQVIPISNINLAILEKSNNVLVVSPLVQTKNTNEIGSLGLVESDKYLAIKINKNIDNLDIILKLNNKNIEYEKIEANENVEILKIKIDNLKNTIKSWNFLREETKNYFTINFNDVGDRVKEPNILKVIANEKEKTIKFDSIDKYTNNINYYFNDIVLNKEKLNTKLPVKNWLANEI